MPSDARRAASPGCPSSSGADVNSAVSADDGRIHQRAGAQEPLALAQQRVDLGQEARRQCVLFKQVPEVEQRLARPPASLVPSASSVVASGTDSTPRSMPVKPRIAWLS